MTISFNPAKWSWLSDHWHHISWKNAYDYRGNDASLSVSSPNRLIPELVTRDGPSNPPQTPIEEVQPKPITVVEENNMSLFTEIEAAGKKIQDVFTEVVTFASKIKTVYSMLSGPTLAAIAAVFYDVVKVVASVESVAADASTGNVTGAITLSQTTITLVKQVVTDFKAGEATVVADFKALGITL